MNASFRGFSFLNALARARTAKARLSEMITQEVSMVDAAANLRRFVVVKRNDTMSEQVAKVALRLPPEAKRGIMDGLATALDKLTALATVVGDAEEDAQVFVPPDLGDALRQCSELVAGLADQYAAAPAPAEPPPADANAPAPDAGVPPEIGAPAPAEPAMMGLGKALPPPEKDSLTLAPEKDPLTMAPQTKSAIAEAFKACASEMAETMKAGRKIAGQRYKKLAELHDTLGKLLNELAYDDAADAAGIAGAEGAPAAKACATGGKDKTKKEDETPVAKAADPSVTQVLALAKAGAEAIAKQGEAVAKSRTPETPRARSAEGGGAPSAVRWPLDMSAALAKRKKAEGKAAR
jgi:hypothetical protein